MLLQVQIVIVRFAIKLYDQDKKLNELVSTADCLIQSIKDKLPKVLYINNVYVQYKCRYFHQ